MKPPSKGSRDERGPQYPPDVLAKALRGMEKVVYSLHGNPERRSRSTYELLGKTYAFDDEFLDRILDEVDRLRTTSLLAWCDPGS